MAEKASTLVQCKRAEYLIWKLLDAVLHTPITNVYKIHKMAAVFTDQHSPAVGLVPRPPPFLFF